MNKSRHDEAADWSGAASDRLIRRVLQFAHLLRSDGVAVTSGRVIDAQRSLAHIDVGRRDDFYHALRANLIARPEDFPHFDSRFTSFWDGKLSPAAQIENRGGTDKPDSSRDGGESTRVTPQGERAHDSKPDEDESQEHLSRGATEVLVAKDFGTLNQSELRQMQKIMTRLAPKMLILRSRRFRPGMSGSQLDFRRTLRQSLSTGSDVIDLSWRRRQVDTARLVLLCDISHSMEKYSRFLIQFMYAFQNELPNTETFVFSTRLTRLTDTLRNRQLDDALQRAASASAGWSSGTKIGACFEEFNRRDGPKLLDRRTVVVILSDGWDQGEPSLLAAQMAAIKRRSRLVVWLNPLLGDPRYRPLVSGMHAALPHVDLFRPCHNLASLQAFAAELSKV